MKVNHVRSGTVQMRASGSQSDPVSVGQSVTQDVPNPTQPHNPQQQKKERPNCISRPMSMRYGWRLDPGTDPGFHDPMPGSDASHASAIMVGL